MKKQHYIIILFISFIILFGYLLYKIDPKYLFSNDSLVKLIQAESLVKSSFTTQELYYPARNIDPDYNFFPYRERYLLNNNSRHIGQYPIFFSFFTAVTLKIFTPQSLPVVCLILSFLTLALFHRYWKPHIVTFIMAGIGTPILFMGINFTEHPLLLFFHTLGLSLYFKSGNESYKKIIHLIAGITLAIGIWLRLEILIFVFLLILFILIIRYKFNILNFLKSEIYLIIGLSISILSFLIFNYFDYNHIFGPRYMANYASTPKGLQDYALQIFLLLFGWKNQIGFFGYMPIFLIAFIFFIKKSNFIKLSVDERIIYLCTISFILIVTIVAPDYGVSNWCPRFMYLALIPSLIIFDKFYTVINISSKLKNIIIYFLIIYSVFIGFIGLTLLNFVVKDLKSVRNENTIADIDLKIFSNYMFGAYVGLDYFDNNIIFIRDVNSFNNIKTIISNNHSYKKIAYIELRIPKEVEQQAASLSSDMNSLITDLKTREAVKADILKTWKLIEKRELKKITIYILSNQSP